MNSWRDKLNVSRARATRMSRNGQIVVPAEARRAAGIEPGDLVVSVPVAPGTVLVEKVRGAKGQSLRRQYEAPDNPLVGVWGPDPDAWLDELRRGWAERETS